LVFDNNIAVTNNEDNIILDLKREKAREA